MRDRVHLAVDAATADLTPDDLVLAGALASRGITVEPVVWGADLPAGSTLVLRSVWDYVDQPARFCQWLATLDANGVDVHNPTATVRWNMHKGYLPQLAGRGVPTVPTTIVKAGTTDRDLTAIMSKEGWTDAVVKPAIGGTARSTIHVASSGMVAAAAHLRALAAAEDALVQPFVPSVLDRGETSIVVVAGELTHVVRKVPADGDWRVQSDFGGTSPAHCGRAVPPGLRRRRPRGDRPGPAVRPHRRGRRVRRRAAAAGARARRAGAVLPPRPGRRLPPRRRAATLTRATATAPSVPWPSRSSVRSGRAEEIPQSHEPSSHQSWFIW